jgi:uroporphyrinogen decarboxylase
MTSRELVIRALGHQPTERPPREVLIGRDVEAACPDEVNELAARFPNDIVRLRAKYPDGRRTKRGKSDEAPYTDAWGSTWQLISTDNGASTRRELIDAPLSNLRSLSKFEPPMEVLDGLRLGKVNSACAQTNRFTLAPVQAGLLERVLGLRGPMAARKDLTAATKGIRNLLAMVHEYCLREVELWAGSEADGVVLRDDFSSVPIVLEDRGLWRELLRPLYKDYFRIVRNHDKFLVFRGGGDILPVLTDLIRCGIDAVECALPGVDVERLAKRYRGRVTFLYGMDQPDLLIHGQPTEVRESVNRVRRAFDYGSGGIVACCRWLPGAGVERMAAFCEQWTIPMPVHTR